jgi:hypothetical protein
MKGATKKLLESLGIEQIAQGDWVIVHRNQNNFYFPSASDGTQLAQDQVCFVTSNCVIFADNHYRCPACGKRHENNYTVQLQGNPKTFIVPGCMVKLTIPPIGSERPIRFVEEPTNSEILAAHYAAQEVA